MSIKVTSKIATTRRVFVIAGSLTFSIFTNGCSSEPPIIEDDVAYKLLSRSVACPIVIKDKGSASTVPAIEKKDGFLGFGGKMDMDCAFVKDGKVTASKWFGGEANQEGSVLQPSGLLVQTKYIDTEYEPLIISDMLTPEEQKQLTRYVAAKFTTTSPNAKEFEKLTGTPWTLQPLPMSTALAYAEKGKFQYPPQFTTKRATQSNISTLSTGNLSNNARTVRSSIGSLPKGTGINAGGTSIKVPNRTQPVTSVRLPYNDTNLNTLLPADKFAFKTTYNGGTYILITNQF